MGLVTFSPFHVFFSMSTRVERRTIFSLDILSDMTFIKACGVSILTLIMATVFEPLQRFLGTTRLDVQQWIICIFVALSIIVATEIRTIILRRKTAREIVPA
jgi:Ca2+-transporting ATPase